MQLCTITLTQFYEKAPQCEINVTGLIRQIFQHKVILRELQKYIIEMKIGPILVLRALRRYSEFEAFYSLLLMKFKNIQFNIGEFPSKYQVSHKQETRRQYFLNLLNKILQIFCEQPTNDMNRRLLSITYAFLTNNNNLTQEQQKKMNYLMINEVQSKVEDSSINLSALSASQKKNPQVKVNKGRKNIFEEIPKNQEQAKMRLFVSSVFLVKLDNQNQWKERYLKLESSCLLIFKHKNENNFRSRIELFQTTVEFYRRQNNIFDQFCQKMEFSHQPEYDEDNKIISISHYYDSKKLLIKVRPQILQQGEPEKATLTQIAKEILEKASIQPSFRENFEGVFKPIGKMFIILHKVLKRIFKPIKDNQHFTVKISSQAFEYESMRLSGTAVSSEHLLINQGFMIPISSSFQIIKVEIFIENQNKLRHEASKICIGSYNIHFADFISYSNGYGIDKAWIKLQNQSKLNDFQCKIEMSVSNISHRSSVYADSYANQNDGVRLAGLRKSSPQQLNLTVDRVLRILGKIALFIQNFWRNVYLFKYPRAGRIFFTSLMIFFIFGGFSTFFYFLLSLLIISILYHIPFSRDFVDSYFQNLFLGQTHSSFIKPLCLSKSQLKFIKWSNLFETLPNKFRINQQNRLQKIEKNQKFIEYIVEKHGKQFKIKQELPSFIEKIFQVKKVIENLIRIISGAVNTLEKIANIISWADPKRTFFVLILLIVLFNVANLYFLRIIIILFCIHRLVKGKNFYHKKIYKNNKRLAIYLIRYIMNKSFQHLLPFQKKKITQLQQDKLISLFRFISFPLNESNQLEILKEQIQDKLAVYLDDEELKNHRDEKYGGICLIQLVKIIQSCEARLKLQLVSGAEGISNEFQQLIRKSKQEQLMDVWLESLIMNFVLNIPSQLYSTFRTLKSRSFINNKDEISLPYQKVKM